MYAKRGIATEAGVGWNRYGIGVEWNGWGGVERGCISHTVGRRRRRLPG